MSSPKKQHNANWKNNLSAFRRMKISGRSDIYGASFLWQWSNSPKKCNVSPKILSSKSSGRRRKGRRKKFKIIIYKCVNKFYRKSIRLGVGTFGKPEGRKLERCLVSADFLRFSLGLVVERSQRRSQQKADGDARRLRNASLRTSEASGQRENWQLNKSSSWRQKRDEASLSVK